MVTRTNQFGEVEHLTIVPLFMVETTQGQVDEAKVQRFMENMPDALPTGAKYGRADGMIKLRDGHHRLEAERRLGSDHVWMWVVDQSQPDGLSKARQPTLWTIANKVKNPPGADNGAARGGFHEDPEDHSQWYVKDHSTRSKPYTRNGDKLDLNQHWSEHLTNRAYRAFGVHAPLTYIKQRHVGNPTPVLMSKIIPGLSTIHHIITTQDGYDGSTKGYSLKHPEYAKRLLHGEAADRVLGVQDLHSRNMGVVGVHTPVRIDSGHNFMHDAYGAKHRHPEWMHPFHDYEVDPFNRGTHELARKALRLRTYTPHLVGERAEPGTPEHRDFLRPQMQKISRVLEQHGGWKGFVERHAGSADKEFKQEAVNTLEHRTSQMHEYVNEHASKSFSVDMDLKKSEDPDEYIHAPAIKTTTGAIFHGGKSHASVIGQMTAAIKRGELHHSELLAAAEDYHNSCGYITTKGRFLNRADAFKMAQARGQTKHADSWHGGLESDNVEFRKSLTVVGPTHVPDAGLILGVDPSKEAAYQYQFEHHPTGRKGTLILSVPHKDNADRWAKIMDVSVAHLPTDSSKKLSEGDHSMNYRANLPHKDIVELGRHIKENHPHVKGIATGMYHDAVLGQEEGPIIPRINQAQQS